MSIETRTATAIERIKTAFLYNPRTMSGHSGGKDSVVIHDLIRKSGCTPAATIHSPKPLIDNCTEDEKSTAMHLETLTFLYETVGIEWPVLILPRHLTQQWLNDNQITCQIDGSRLVEYTRSDKSGHFIRNGELVSRAEMTEYQTNGIFGLNLAYPIFDWTDDDVFEYIEHNELAISDEYLTNGELNDYFNRKGDDSSAAC